ncbi:MAG: hypothetical protein RLZZ333_1831, partial [Bacteroidota bacterium]
MANRLKSTKTEADAEILVDDKEEVIEVKSLFRDERTHKIIGSAFLFICFFLFVAFTSYLFTWSEDQDKIRDMGARILSPNELEINNLLGSFGAYVAFVFFEYGFGIASYLFCSLFFVIGINLLFDKSVFSIARNVRYLMMGLLVISVSAAFFAPQSSFNFGGAFGKFSSNWLKSVIGWAGTFALLSLSVFSYVIWRFNPMFKWPVFSLKKSASEQDVSLDQPLADEALEPEEVQPRLDLTEGNSLNEEANQFQPPPVVDPLMGPLNIITEPISEPAPAIINTPAPPPDEVNEESNVEELPLEIKPTAEEQTDVVKTAASVLASPKFDPIADLKGYKYPSLDLLAQHSGEKIVMDQHELEANKSQIMKTLQDYDIEIQKIFATVGPTVTLYEIIPAAGVRISRIKNLEDDIALSLSALGIRIIAPIPGKGTIGIEVPNVKKSIVGMRSLLG